MKRWVGFLVSLLLLVGVSAVRGESWLSVGSTVSYFTDARDAKPKVGLFVGFRWEHHLWRKFSFSYGVDFASRGVILKNRSMAVTRLS